MGFTWRFHPLWRTALITVVVLSICKDSILVEAANEDKDEPLPSNVGIKSLFSAVPEQLEDGSCQCTISVPSLDNICSSQHQYEQILVLQQQLTSLQQAVAIFQPGVLQLQIETLTTQMEELTTNIHSQPVALSLSSLTHLQGQLQDITTWVSNLQDNTEDIEHIESIHTSLLEIHTDLMALMDQNPNNVNDALQDEIDRLNDKLVACQENYTEHIIAGGDFLENMHLPIDTALTTSCANKELESVSNPTTLFYASNVRSASFVKDPYPIREDRKQTIYYIYSASSSSSNYVNVLQEFADYNAYIKGHVSRTIGLYYGVYGTGHVAYHGNMYHVSGYYKNRIYKTYLDSDTNSYSAYLTIPCSTSAYLSTSVSASIPDYIDLKVDETGLWAVYGKLNNADDFLMVSKLDAENLTIIETWETPIRKSMVSHTFIICGVLYTVSANSYWKSNTEFMEAYYDTNTGESGYIPLFVPSRYGGLVQLTYNPRERLLFGWDNYHAVTYNLQFKGYE